MFSFFIAICVLISCVLPMGPTAIEAISTLGELTNPEIVFEVKQSSVLELKNLELIMNDYGTKIIADEENVSSNKFPDKYTKIITDANGLVKGTKASLNYNVALNDGSAANLAIKQDGGYTYVNTDGVKQLLAITPESSKFNLSAANNAIGRVGTDYIAINNPEEMSTEEKISVLGGINVFMSGIGDNGLLTKTNDGYIYTLEFSKLPTVFDSVFDKVISTDPFKQMVEGEEPSTIAEMKNGMKSVIVELSEKLNGSFVYAEFKKANDSYSLNINMMIFYNGTNVATYQQESIITKTNLSDFDTGIAGHPTIAYDVVEDYYYIDLAKQSLVDEMYITWTANSEYTSDSFTVDYMNNDGYQFDRNFDMVYKDGRIYLPLRTTCETFNENVEWDSVNSKAYVVRGNDKIDMTGMIVNGKTYVMIRDFETNLGYYLDYQGEDGYHNVTLKKI